jgi:hypothetical protein
LFARPEYGRSKELHLQSQAAPEACSCETRAPGWGAAVSTPENKILSPDRKGKARCRVTSNGAARPNSMQGDGTQMTVGPAPGYRVGLSAIQLRGVPRKGHGRPRRPGYALRAVPASRYPPTPRLSRRISLLYLPPLRSPGRRNLPRRRETGTCPRGSRPARSSPGSRPPRPAEPAA